MFEKKQTLPLLLYNEHWQKEKKYLAAKKKPALLFALLLPLLVCLLVYQRIKKMVQERQDSEYSG